MCVVCYNHVVLTPQPKYFMPMSSTCQTLCITARPTLRCPASHPTHAMAPVKHAVHKVFGLFLLWDLLWYLLPICPQTSVPAACCPTAGEAVMKCRCQKCLLPLCKAVWLEKLVCSFCSLELHLHPGMKRWTKVVFPLSISLSGP